MGKRIAVRKILSEEMTLKQRYKRSEGDSYTNIREKHLNVQNMAEQKQKTEMRL